MKLKLRNIGEIIAVASVVFSLLFVGYERCLGEELTADERVVFNNVAQTFFNLQYVQRAR